MMHENNSIISHWNILIYGNFYNFPNGLRYPHGVQVETINMILVWLASLPDIFKTITLRRRSIIIIVNT